MSNRTFFKQVKEGQMSLGDIFSEVGRKHSPKETAKVLISGTELTTPSEAEMLSGWQKPFLFARFFGGFLAVILLTCLLGTVLAYEGASFLLMVEIPFLVPLTLLLLVWEMNVPRNISLYEILKIVAVGGILSIIAAIIGFRIESPEMDAWAGLIEEPAKLLVIYMILKRKNYPYAINGVLIGMAVGAGFAIMESLVYTFSLFYGGIITGVNQLLNGEWIQDDILRYGFFCGLETAIARALVALSGHGVFAALYGGALVKAKGTDEVQLSHLAKPEFLLYFAVSILLHALHNYGLNLGLPQIKILTFQAQNGDTVAGTLRSEYIIIGVIAVILLLNSLRSGVNQVVTICAGKNGGRVTQAVYRGESGNPVFAAGIFTLEGTAGPCAGQVFQLKAGQALTIGRSSGNDIPLPGCANVSSEHCRVSVENGRVTVTDLKSTNGTYLDSQRLLPRVSTSAANGSVIYLGNKSCAFRVRAQ